MNFKSIIPLNCIKVMSNGDIRLTMDIDKIYASVIPEIMGLSGQMVGVVIIGEDEAKQIIKTPREKLIAKIHVLMNEIATMQNKSVEVFKKEFKERKGIKISFAVMDSDYLGDVVYELEKLRE